MKYTLVEYSDGVAIETDDGTQIWSDTGSWQWPNDDALNSILDDANFGQPQKDALRAITGLIDRDRQLDESVSG